jgi:transcriptional regulator with XRE-family HTH domain
VILLNTRLREVRKSLKLTQQEFGSKIGLSKASIGNIENGIINLTDRNISLICSTYNVNEDWLRNGNGEMFNPMTEDEEFAYLVGALLAEDCDYKKKFIKSMLELDDELDWMIVTNLVEGLKKKNEKK